MNPQGFKDTLIQALTPGNTIHTPHRTRGASNQNRGYAIELWMARETATYIRERAGGARVTPAVSAVRSVGTGAAARTEARLSFEGPGLAESLTVYFTQSGPNAALQIERDTPLGPERVWSAHGRESREYGLSTIRTLETA
jgi:hypothetical protein